MDFICINQVKKLLLKIQSINEMDKIVPKPIELYLVEKTYIFRVIMRNFHIIMHNVRE